MKNHAFFLFFSAFDSSLFILKRYKLKGGKWI
ncbi:Hypothetical Protein MfeM64YM_0222 [Mycoplasmopsis fermentans M64]|uniref:Uncharacterized protein n=1 Tax=Mycoplasmopsis fermentans (strain M64) TaxID=943945 RepID=A0AB32XB99_MYCFM|nr:Hypothetical Protein MfeM64YM_0222 [Mycoplasmopsis fermentans M64]